MNQDEFNRAKSYYESVIPLVLLWDIYNQREKQKAENNIQFNLTHSVLDISTSKSALKRLLEEELIESHNELESRTEEVRKTHRSGIECEFQEVVDIRLENWEESFEKKLFELIDTAIENDIRAFRAYGRTLLEIAKSTLKSVFTLGWRSLPEGYETKLNWYLVIFYLWFYKAIKIHDIASESQPMVQFDNGQKSSPWDSLSFKVEYSPQGAVDYAVLKDDEKIFEYGAWTILYVGNFNNKPSVKEVRYEKRRLNLRLQRRRVLASLARAKGKIVFRNTIAEDISDEDKIVSDNTIKVCISEIRKEIDDKKKSKIETHPEGYSLSGY